MAMAATARRLRASHPTDRTLRGLAVVGAALCVLSTIALAAGHVAGAGASAVAAAAFLLLVGWCASHRRADQTLVALGLYLGLLDGYVKLSTGSSTITLARDVIVVAIACGALLRAMRSEQRLKLPPLGGLALAFGVVVLIELANPESRGLAAGLAGVRQHLGYAFIRRDSQIEKLLFVLVFCAAAGGVISYIQSTLTPQELADWGSGYRERILGTGAFTGAARVGFDIGGGTSVRPFGLGSDAGSGALAAALALPGLIALAMTGSGRVRLALTPLAAGIGLAIVTSGSRAALVTVFVSVVVFGAIAAASKNGLRAVLGLALGIAVVFAVFQQVGLGTSSTKRAQSIAPSRAVTTFSTERGTSVAQFGSLASEHPLGVGVGTVGPAASFARSAGSASFDSETQWNFLILELGLAGLVIYVGLNLRLLSLSMTRIRRIHDRALRLNLAAVAAPLYALIVAGFAGPTTASAPSAPYLWLVAGVLSYWLASGHTREGRAGASGSPPP
jgi:O-Antigen ligase